MNSPRDKTVHPSRVMYPNWTETWLRGSHSCPLCSSTQLDEKVHTDLLLVLRCEQCDLHFVSPEKPRSKGVSEYYKDFNLDDYIAYYGPFRSRVFRDNWKRIAGWKSSGTALDYGTSFGWFLQAAPPGWKARGIEPATEVAQRARAQGLDVHTGGEDVFGADTETYDLITMWNVIEHVPSPGEVLNLAKARLKTDGILAVSFPNRKGLFNRLCYLGYTLGGGNFAAPLHTMFQVHNPAPHLWHFAPDNMIHLLKSTGFEPFARDSQPIIDLKGLEQRAKIEPGGGGIASSKIGRAIMTSVYHASFLLRMSDEIVIYARPSKASGGTV